MLYLFGKLLTCRILACPEFANFSCTRTFHVHSLYCLILRRYFYIDIPCGKSRNFEIFNEKLQFFLNLWQLENEEQHCWVLCLTHNKPASVTELTISSHQLLLILALRIYVLFTESAIKRLPWINLRRNQWLIDTISGHNVNRDILYPNLISTISFFNSFSKQNEIL